MGDFADVAEEIISVTGEPSLPTPKGKRDLPQSLLDDLGSHATWLESGGARGTQLDWRGKDLTNYNLSWKKLERARLDGADLSGAFMDHANLKDASVRGARVTRTDLTFANLAGADTSGTNLRHADIEFNKKQTLLTARLGPFQRLRARLIMPKILSVMHE